MEYCSHKTPVCVRPEYTIFYQCIEGQLIWVHMDVRQWSAEIFKRMRQDCDTLQSLIGQRVYTMNEPQGCKKHQKFLKLMGWEYHTNLEMGGADRLIYRRG